MSRHLARVVLRRGRPQEAEAIVRPSLDGHRRILGPEHPETLSMLYELTLALKAQGRLTEEGPLVRELITAWRKKPEEGVGELKSALALLNTWWTQFEASQASADEPLLLEALEISRTFSPSDLLRVAVADRALADFLAARGRYGEAEPLLLDAYRLTEEVRARPALRVATVTSQRLERQAIDPLITLYERWGKPVKAAQWRLKSLDAVFPDDPFVPMTGR
jgi:hypothetical protein